MKEEGRFQNRIIKQIIHKTWFGHSNALGCVYEGFNPIPHPMIALVMACVSTVSISANRLPDWHADFIRC